MKVYFLKRSHSKIKKVLLDGIYNPHLIKPYNVEESSGFLGHYLIPILHLKINALAAVYYRIPFRPLIFQWL